MTPVALIGMLGACVGLTVACWGLAISSAPGWRSQRAFYLLALACGIYCACDVVATLEVPLIWRQRALRVSLSALCAGVVCSFLLARERFPSAGLLPVSRAFIAVNLPLGALALVPGLVTSSEIRIRRLELLGVTYYDVVSTPFGDAVLVVLGLSLVTLAVHFARSRSRGLPEARLYVGFVVLMLCAFVFDVLAYEGWVNGPYLASFTFASVMVVMSASTVRRFIEGAQALERLSAELEERVEARTRELSEANTALARAEKLAAVGQLAAGVAHEINNPAAAVQANLNYLFDVLSEGRLPPDALESISDSREAMFRIDSIVRRMIDTGRAARAREESAEVTNVSRTAQDVVARVREVVPPSARVDMEIPENLHTRGNPVLLSQILTQLIVNSGQAIAAGRGHGSIAVRAASLGAEVLLEVVDDGCGMDEGTQRRLFEPFFTTQPVGKGTGLGLSVVKGLATSLGGSLSVESSIGLGTAMRLRLPAAPTGRI